MGSGSSTGQRNDLEEGLNLIEGKAAYHLVPIYRADDE